MNRFELFSIVFCALDAEWEETKDEELGRFLSDMNPFAFSDIGSAEPSVYERFCQTVPDTISMEKSYSTAIKYLDSLERDDLKRSFLQTDPEEWAECAKEYLSGPHKGEEAGD